MRAIFIGCATVCAFTLGLDSKADVVIQFDEVTQGATTSVVANLSGTYDLDATLGLNFTGNTSGLVRPEFGFVAFSGPADFYLLDIALPMPIGIGETTLFNTESGDSFAISNGVIAVPSGYVSGGVLSSSAAVSDKTFAEMGMTLGTYVNTFSNGSVSDTVTVIVGSAAVPEPGSLALLSLLGVAGLLRRRRSGVLVQRC